MQQRSNIEAEAPSVLWLVSSVRRDAVHSRKRFSSSVPGILLDELPTQKYWAGKTIPSILENLPDRCHTDDLNLNARFVAPLALEGSSESLPTTCLSVVWPLINKGKIVENAFTI
ncbi:hypothetical protein PM082_021843 [Marasmius tenuissimus]|nr:hypothetical protein PM082_021843 [Marasmius tenuissimus]